LSLPFSRAVRILCGSNERTDTGSVAHVNGPCRRGIVPPVEVVSSFSTCTCQEKHAKPEREEGPQPFSARQETPPLLLHSKEGGVSVGQGGRWRLGGTSAGE